MKSYEHLIFPIYSILTAGHASLRSEINPPRLREILARLLNRSLNPQQKRRLPLVQLAHLIILEQLLPVSTTHHPTPSLNQLTLSANIS
jgi:hypothetical protein